MSTISGRRKVGSFSYLGGGIPIVSRRSLLFLVPVKVTKGQLGGKNRNINKDNNSH